ncbi:hypothetical protein K450DRAFT_258017 [Umbelopsis ramanniana AG]|uniref:Uncharacterized protein n=1 Tax=Umbelopsis ramanniana AG TaxID=1314678 RepID=A0AAD5H9N7_UMBRA|nr:uncharacterized protein K450DRAFT_258017 [Umbelopsis ramanniana AG]KAI8576182.1 hypothetical protein K450DRAFT_258017 [Umbelopsis ramanniana AG]
MQRTSSMRVDSVALDVDGPGQIHRLSGDELQRQYSYASTAPSAPEEPRRRSTHPRRSTLMSLNSNKDDKNKLRARKRSKARLAKAEDWIPEWRRFSIKDTFGIIFALAGAILTLMCLTSATSSSMSNVYFARVYKRDGGVGEARFGLRGYCISTQSSSMQCYPSTDFIYIPWDATTSKFLNTTFPTWFEDSITPDQDIDPLATPSPPHDVSITAAMSISVICALIGIICQISRFIRGFRYGDSNYTRGFLLAFATVTSLLSMALSLLMYLNGCQELETEYPHVQTRIGPCLAMIGTAFGCLLLSTILFFDKFLHDDRQLY